MEHLSNIHTYYLTIVSLYIILLKDYIFKRRCHEIPSLKIRKLKMTVEKVVHITILLNITGLHGDKNFGRYLPK